MFSSQPVTPPTPPSGLPSRPAGVLPRHLQTWVVLGTAVVMTAIIALSGTSRPADRPPIAGAPQAMEANDARIQEYRKRIDEEARRLSAAQAELDLAKRSLTSTPPSLAEPTRPPTAATSPGESAIENERRQKAYHALFADNVALSRRTPESSASADQSAVASAKTAPSGQDAATASAAQKDAPTSSPASKTYPIREGTIIEAVLTNRLDGTFVGPVNAMVTADVYTVDRRHRLIPQDTYARSLYFMDARLADATIEANKKSKAIERFITDPREEIDVRVKNVTLEDIRLPPYRAPVDFEKVFYTPADHLEIRREAFVGQFVFVVQDQVPNAVIPINPLGWTITYFREDQAFGAESGGAK